jgi:hypothetical protein
MALSVNLICFERARLQAVPRVPQINGGFSRWGNVDFKLRPCQYYKRIASAWWRR